MVSRKMENLLVNLAKIERGISRIYEHLSKIEAFTPPVRQFWRNIMEEERMHEKIFNDIRNRATSDDSFEIEIDTDLEELKLFVKKVNALLERFKKSDITESEAYSVGATLEVEIDEANFLKLIRTNDPEITRMINRIESDTRKHRVMMVNYAKGIR